MRIRLLAKTNQEKKKWIKKNSPAYNVIEKVVLDKKNLNDMDHLANTYHTGSLEVFHSLLNSYASKRQEFELNVMVARVKLAILDHNDNVYRKQATISKARKGSGKIGDSQWKYLSSKLSKEWVAKPKKEAKSFKFVERLLTEVVERKKSGEKINTKASDLQNRLNTPTNIAFTNRPDKSIILEKYNKMKRFKK